MIRHQHFLFFVRRPAAFFHISAARALCAHNPAPCFHTSSPAACRPPQHPPPPTQDNHLFFCPPAAAAAASLTAAACLSPAVAAPLHLSTCACTPPFHIKILAAPLSGKLTSNHLKLICLRSAPELCVCDRIGCRCQRLSSAAFQNVKRREPRRRPPPTAGVRAPQPKRRRQNAARGPWLVGHSPLI